MQTRQSRRLRGEDPEEIKSEQPARRFQRLGEPLSEMMETSNPLQAAADGAGAAAAAAVNAAQDATAQGVPSAEAAPVVQAAQEATANAQAAQDAANQGDAPAARVYQARAQAAAQRAQALARAIAQRGGGFRSRSVQAQARRVLGLTADDQNKVNNIVAELNAERVSANQYGAAAEDLVKFYGLSLTDESIKNRTMADGSIALDANGYLSFQDGKIHLRVFGEDEIVPFLPRADEKSGKHLATVLKRISKRSCMVVGATEGGLTPAQLGMSGTYPGAEASALVALIKANPRYKAAAAARASARKDTSKTIKNANKALAKINAKEAKIAIGGLREAVLGVKKSTKGFNAALRFGSS